MASNTYSYIKIGETGELIPIYDIKAGHIDKTESISEFWKFMKGIGFGNIAQVTINEDTITFGPTNTTTVAGGDN